MHSEILPHEKIRFRRSDAMRLDELPSAVAGVHPRKRSRLRSLYRFALFTIAGLTLLACVSIAAIVGGVGDLRLRDEVQRSLQRLAGDQYPATIGATSVSINGAGTIVLRAQDLRIDHALQVARLDLGLRALPLARGGIRVKSVRVADATIDLAALPQADAGAQLDLFDEDGLVDPDVVINAVFSSVHQLLDVFDLRDMERISLRNVAIDPAGATDNGRVQISSADIERNRRGRLSLSGEFSVGGRLAAVEGSVTIDPSSKRLRGVSLAVDIPEVPENAELAGWAGKFASANVTLGGSQLLEAESITVSAQVAGLNFSVGRHELVTDISVDATAAAGTGKLELNRVLVEDGRYSWDFHGALGPEPADSANRGYRFELVSDGSESAPADSPEAAAPILARISGRMDRDFQQIDVEEIVGRAPIGELAGRASMRFQPGKSPGVQFRIGVQEMPVSYSKQLWPWFAATPARTWVLNNVFGGVVEAGQVELNVPPGRLGNGVPLGADEVFGAFSIRNTRFDVAGRLPPVRDAIGKVSFRGTDVDISLESGTAYMPTGRTVTGQSGTLTIDNAHIRPTIGKLNIGISGEADAVLELAGYDPINVGRYIDFKPEEFSGNVIGSVTADIPLHRGIPVETLGWQVSLDYEGVSLSREFDGQKITNASGSMVVDPGSAQIKAKAQLNGAPASIDLLEPLGTDKSKRRRLVELQLDDDALRRLAPGLRQILSGSIGVKFDAAASDGRELNVSLDRSALSLPWVGWSKGAGVPGSASFKMNSDGEKLSLTDFKLQGDSFGASGSLTLSNGALQSARLSSVRLNRSDDFTVNVTAKGNGYNVSIRGKRADARSIIKIYTAMGGGNAVKEAAPALSLDLQLDQMTGFHSEELRNVRLSYSGNGSRADRVEFSAITASGRPVAFVDTDQGGSRRIDMTSTDAGAVLRFLNLYEYMRGGEISLALSGPRGGALSGSIDARNFWIVNEPRLSSLVSSTPPGDNRSLSQAVRREIDTQSVEFERGYSRIVKGDNGISLEGGILRGPLIGMSFQGMLSDAQGNVALTGTFMPAYGLNRIFGEIPLIGQILGNGRDRGLIGITFRLLGAKDNPQLAINPLSVVAPGIFRSVFEFR